MLFIQYVCRVPLRMSEADMLIGDDAVHGEGAYCFFDDMAGPTPEGDGQILEGLNVGRDLEIGVGGSTGIGNGDVGGEHKGFGTVEQTKRD